jgi:hypothetical protein
MYYYFYYLTEDQGIIRIKAKRKPSKSTRKVSGVWGLKEFDGKNWVMPCFPQITLGVLNKQTYIGKTVV